MMKGHSLRRTTAVVLGLNALFATSLGAGVGMAAPASTGSAFALSATGLLKIEPLPHVDNGKGFQQQSVAAFATPNKAVTADLLNAQAGSGHAKASVADLALDAGQLKLLGAGIPALAASVVAAQCADGAGSASLADAKLGETKLDATPAANTELKVPGIVKVVLNKQHRNRDGSLTVTAISISVNKVQSVDIASVTCAANQDGGPSIPPIPPNSPTTAPAATSTTRPADTDNGHQGGDPAGSQADQNGKAPRPVPVPGHLAVTG